MGLTLKFKNSSSLQPSWVLKTKRFSARSSPIPIPGLKGTPLVLSSDCEGFGNVLVEAIICQTPPVQIALEALLKSSPEL
jgi:hypothetical protein